MNETILVIILGSIAAVLQLVGYVLYAQHVFKARIRPNPASWFIWSYGNALVCFSYVFLNEWSLATSLLPVVCSIACIIMSCVFLIWGKFRPIERFEYGVISMDIAVTAVWVASDFFGKFAVMAPIIHIIVLASAIISFVPIYWELKDDPTSEHSSPWIVWTIAYVLLAITALFSVVSIESLAYPVLYVMLHGLVAFLASRKKFV